MTVFPCVNYFSHLDQKFHQNIGFTLVSSVLFQRKENPLKHVPYYYLATLTHCVVLVRKQWEHFSQDHDVLLLTVWAYDKCPHPGDFHIAVLYISVWYTVLCLQDCGQLGVRLKILVNFSLSMLTCTESKTSGFQKQSQFPWADRGGCLDSSAWLWFSVAATSAPCHSTSTAGQPCLPHPEKQGPRPQLTPQQFPHTVPRRPLTTWMAQRTIWITAMTSRMEKRFRFQEITFSGSRHLLHKDLSLR